MLNSGRVARLPATVLRPQRSPSRPALAPAEALRPKAVRLLPVVAEVVNAVNRSRAGRVLLEKVAGIHRDAPLPPFRSGTARKMLANRSCLPGIHFA